MFGPTNIFLQHFEKLGLNPPFLASPAYSDLVAISVANQREWNKKKYKKQVFHTLHAPLPPQSQKIPHPKSCKKGLADRVSSLIGVNVAGNIQPLCLFWAQPCKRKKEKRPGGI